MAVRAQKVLYGHETASRNLGLRAIDASDIPIHDPHENFDSSVERFIHSAPVTQPMTIKMIVYRVGDDNRLSGRWSRPPTRGSRWPASSS
jgi:polyphosphate kinase